LRGEFFLIAEPVELVTGFLGRFLVLAGEPFQLRGRRDGRFGRLE
jgi:hypothetical protein